MPTSNHRSSLSSSTRSNGRDNYIDDNDDSEGMPVEELREILAARGVPTTAGEKPTTAPVDEKENPKKKRLSFLQEEKSKAQQQHQKTKKPAGKTRTVVVDSHSNLNVKAPLPPQLSRVENVNHRSPPPLPGAFAAHPNGSFDRPLSASISAASSVSYESNVDPSTTNNTIPQATPISAELAADHETTTSKLQELEDKTLELQAKTQEIERLKQSLQHLNDQIHVAAPVAAAVIAVPSSTANNSRPSNARDVATELDSLVLDPAQEEALRIENYAGTTNNHLNHNHQTPMTANRLHFSALGLVGRTAEQDLLAACLDRL